jgi:hypothetical protein
MKNNLKGIYKFWNKYKYLNLKIALILISLQIIHLYWLTTDVVLHRLFGKSFFFFPSQFLIIFIIVDYLEIPALVSGITFYFFKILENFEKKLLFLFVSMILQIYHIFWLTDEIVYEAIFQTIPIVIPPLLAWIAIFIDYLELPVILDLFHRVFRKIE